MGLGALGVLFRISYPPTFKVTRVVTFPRKMGRAEYERISSRSHDYASTLALSAEMKSEGRLISSTERFEEDRAYFTDVFSDREAYANWFSRINSRWYNDKQFRADGFRAEIFEDV